MDFGGNDVKIFMKFKGIILMQQTDLNFSKMFTLTIKKGTCTHMEQNCFLFFPEYIQKNTNSLSKVDT